MKESPDFEEYEATYSKDPVTVTEHHEHDRRTIRYQDGSEALVVGALVQSTRDQVQTIRDSLPTINEKVKIVAEEVNYGDGICLDCGNIQGGCEPDARRYECDDCGEHSVYGIAEAVMMGVPVEGDTDLLFDLI